MRSKKSTPLAAYLRQAGIKQADFGKIVGLIRGWPASQEQVSRWVCGHVSLAGRAWIEQATEGVVSKRSWLKWMADGGSNQGRRTVKRGRKAVA
jgi:hypothetical protein